jgi:hypothetical protein
MKTYLIFTTIIVCIIVNTHFAAAQELTGKGFIGGLNLANIDGSDIPDTEYKAGFTLGGFLTFKMSEQFYLRPELVYIVKGYNMNGRETYREDEYEEIILYDMSAKLNYLEIPILGVYSIFDNFNIYTGPYMEIYLSGEAKGHVTYSTSYNGDAYKETHEIKSSIKPKDVNSPGFGLIFGVEFIAGPVSIGARYSNGLSTVPDSGDEDFKNTNIQFLLGFSL